MHWYSLRKYTSNFLFNLNFSTNSNQNICRNSTLSAHNLNSSFTFQPIEFNWKLNRMHLIYIPNLSACVYMHLGAFL